LTEASSARPPASARFINPETVHPPFGYSHVVEVTAGRPVYIAGQVALDPTEDALIEVEAVAVIAPTEPSGR
jgi:enamine deaminase RidA (YjgF/YER057c/UK114 family)